MDGFKRLFKLINSAYLKKYFLFYSILFAYSSCFASVEVSFITKGGCNNRIIFKDLSTNKAYAYLRQYDESQCPAHTPCFYNICSSSSTCFPGMCSSPGKTMKDLLKYGPYPAKLTDALRAFISANLGYPNHELDKVMSFYSRGRKYITYLTNSGLIDVHVIFSNMPAANNAWQPIHSYILLPGLDMKNYYACYNTPIMTLKNGLYKKPAEKDRHMRIVYCQGSQKIYEVFPKTDKNIPSSCQEIGEYPNLHFTKANCFRYLSRLTA